MSYMVVTAFFLLLNYASKKDINACLVEVIGIIINLCNIEMEVPHK